MGENVKIPDLQGPYSRQTAVNVLDDKINRNIKEQAMLLKFKEWLCYNPPPREVEECIWEMLLGIKR